MRLNPYVYGLLAVVLFLGVIYGAKAAGLWHTSDRVTESGEAVTINVNDVDTVKGWMIFADVSKAFNIPVSEIYAGLNLPADTPPSKTLKEVMRAHKMEVDDLRDWLKRRTEGGK
ncbi:MAG: hypothetical protein QN120_01860 [Armatimonadota bacterium]|nr:hypothetical protein [Armatimonadota bacterium]